MKINTIKTLIPAAENGAPGADSINVIVTGETIVFTEVGQINKVYVDAFLGQTQIGYDSEDFVCSSFSGDTLMDGHVSWSFRVDDDKRFCYAFKLLDKTDLDDSLDFTATVNGTAFKRLIRFTTAFDGEAGRGIKSVIEYYALSKYSTTVTGSWSTAVQTMTATNKYLWNKEVILYTDGETEEKEAHLIGTYGKGIKSVTNYYLATTEASGVTAATEGWTTTVQNVSADKKYLWNYEVVTYEDGTSTSTTPCIIGAYGDQGDALTVTSQKTEYTTSQDGDTIPTSGWQTDVPSVPEGYWLWSRTTIVYSDGTPSITYGKSRNGEDGTSVGDNLLDGANFANNYESHWTTLQGSLVKKAMGKYNGWLLDSRMTGVDVEYAAGSSASTAPTSGWQSTIPSSYTYLWARVVAHYAYGGDEYTPVYLTSYAVTSVNIKYYAAFSDTAPTTSSTWASSQTFPLYPGYRLWLKLNYVGTSVNGNAIVKTTCEMYTQTDQIVHGAAITTKLKANTWYTLSFWAKSYAYYGNRLDIFAWSDGGSYPFTDASAKKYVDGTAEDAQSDCQTIFNLTPSWKKHTLTFKTPSSLSTSYNYYIIFRAIHCNEVYICMPKLEEGTKASAFSLSAIDSIGQRGPALRGPQNWEDVAVGYSFEAGGEDEDFQDVVIYKDNYYVCAQSHTKTASNDPKTEAAKSSTTALWKIGSKFDLVATKILLADYALIKNLGAEALELYDKDGNTIFKVAKTKDSSGNEVAEVTCNTGTFKNIVVTDGTFTGTVKANLFYSPMKEIIGGYTIDLENDPAHSFLTRSPGGDSTIMLPKADDYDGVELQFYHPAGSRESYESILYSKYDNIFYREKQYESVRYLVDATTYTIPTNIMLTLKSIDGDWYVIGGDEYIKN